MILPIDVWPNIGVQIPREDKPKVLARLQRVSKQFYDEFRKEHYWAPLLLTSQYTYPMAFQNFLSDHHLTPIRKEIENCEKEIRIAANHLRNYPKSHNPYQANYKAKMRNQYHNYRWKLISLHKLENDMEQFIQPMALPLEKKMPCKYLLLVQIFKAIFNKVVLLHDVCKLFVDSNLPFPPGSIERTYSKKAMLISSLFFAIIFTLIIS